MSLNPHISSFFSFKSSNPQKIIFLIKSPFFWRNTVYSAWSDYADSFLIKLKQMWKSRSYFFGILFMKKNIFLKKTHFWRFFIGKFRKILTNTPSGKFGQAFRGFLELDLESSCNFGAPWGGKGGIRGEKFWEKCKNVYLVPTFSNKNRQKWLFFGKKYFFHKFNTKKITFAFSYLSELTQEKIS